jgi:type II secretory pathway pseudopilin PulG
MTLPQPGCPPRALTPALSHRSRGKGRGRRVRPARVPRGASLLEVLIALTFIAIFAAGFAGVAVSVVTGNAKAKSTDIGVFLAHDRLEQIRNTAYSSVTTANFPAENYGTISIGSPPVSFPDYRRTVAVQDNTPTQGIKRVVVTVSWRGGSLSEEMLVAQ